MAQKPEGSPKCYTWNHLWPNMTGSLQLTVLQMYITLQPVTRSNVTLSWLYGLDKQNSSAGIWVRNPHVSHRDGKMSTSGFRQFLCAKRGLELKQSKVSLSWLPESDKSWQIEIKLRLMEIKCLFTLATKHILGFCPSSWRGIPQVQHCWCTMTTYRNSAVWRDDIWNEHRQVWPRDHSERKMSFILQHTGRETIFRCGRFCCFVCSVIHYHHQAPRKSTRL